MKKSVRLARRFVLAAAIAALAAGAAQAGSWYSGRVTLPDDVFWGGSLVPAGEYKLVMETMAGPLQVIDSSGRVRALVSGFPDAATAAQPTALLITRDGSQRTVRSFNCPPWGHKFVYKPFTRAERDLVARGDELQVVAVRTASR